MAAGGGRAFVYYFSASKRSCLLTKSFSRTMAVLLFNMFPSCPPLGKPMSVLRFPISQGLICCFCGVKQLKLRGYNKHTHTHTRSPPDKMPVHRRDLTLILSLWLSILNQSAAQVLLLLKGFSCVSILCKTSNSIWKDAPEVQPGSQRIVRE